MRKEVISAVLIGIVLGFVIIYGLQIANKSAQEAASTTNSVPSTTNNSNQPTNTNVQPTTTGLNISSPTNNTISQQDSITVTGTSFPSSTVIVSTDEEELVIDADANGVFTTTIKLTSGENTLKVAAVNPSTNKLETKELTIIYSTANLE